jgi:pimeloyl-ACP methyl ester carboxylesterase
MSADPSPPASSYETFVERDDGASVYVRTLGDVGAPAILILDGIGCSGWAFRRIAPALAARGHRVILPHYRGHGRSPDPPRPWRIGMPDLADDAAAVLDALEIERATLVGFSMGFQVSLEVYRRHRSRVTALVSLAGPAGRVLETFGGTGALGHVFPLLRGVAKHAGDLTGRLWRKLVPSRWIVDIGLMTQLNAERLDVEAFGFYLDQMAAMNPELFIDMLGEASRHTAHDLLPQIQVPALVLAGAHDTFVPLATMREIAFAIPGAEWVVLGEASHALPAEYPDEVIERVGDFAAALGA